MKTIGEVVGVAHDVFVSYSSQNKPVADAVVAGLEQAGLRCWVAPRDITPGVSWGAAIMDAISTSRAMVVVLSVASNASPQVLREVERAVAAGLVVVPFRIEAMDPTGAMAYFLSAQHWMDALTPPIQRHIEHLAASITGLLTAPSSDTGTHRFAIPAAKGAADRTQPWYRRPATLVAGAALVVTAIVGSVLISSGGDPDAATTSTTAAVAAPETSVVTTVPDTTTTEGSTTTAVVAGANAAVVIPGVTWTRVPHVQTVFGGDGDVEINAVTAGGVGLVAVGSDASGGDTDAAAWVSADGLSWVRVPHNEVVLGGTNSQVMMGVAAAGPGLVAVGTDTSGGTTAAAVWVSADGFTWERVVHDAAVFGATGATSMTSVTASETTLVAVGSVDAGDGVRIAAWTSTDGFTWKRFDDIGIWALDGRRQVLNSVTAGGGGFVAAGAIYDMGGGGAVQDRGLMYSSRNGTDWNDVVGPGVVGSCESSGGSARSFDVVAAADTGLLVAFGTKLTPERPPWGCTSTNGTDWTVIEMDDTGISIKGLAADGTGWVAVGVDGSDAAVWTSVTGRSWTRLTHDDAIFGGTGYRSMEAVTVGPQGLVAVGYEVIPGEHRVAAIWVGPQRG